MNNEPKQTDWAAVATQGLIVIFLGWIIFWIANCPAWSGP